MREASSGHTRGEPEIEDTYALMRCCNGRLGSGMMDILVSVNQLFLLTKIELIKLLLG